MSIHTEPLKDISFVEAYMFEFRAEVASRLAKYGVWIAALLAIASLAVWGFFRQFSQILGMTALLATLTTSLALYPRLQRQEKESTAIYVILVTFLLLAVGLLTLLPDLAPAALLIYLFALVLGHLLLGAKTGRWFVRGGAALMIVNFVLIKVLAFTWFMPLYETLALVMNAVLMSAVTLGVALFVEHYTAAQELYLKRFREEQLAELQSTVQRYVEYMHQMAQGNLSQPLILEDNGHHPDGPLTILGQNLNVMADSLRNMIVQTKDAVNNLSSATAEILAATAQQAAGASEQSAAISETTTTVDELKTIAEQASRRSQEVASAAQRNVDISQSGQMAVQDTIESMEQIKERVEGIAENILALSEQTQQIGEIIATVNDIASQSNILALNASVEAARAGEHGKGFAVVAVEVRNLAEQSKNATAQVKAILSEIQKATNATVMATEEGTKRVDEGVQLAAQARRAIEQLSGVINESAQAAVQVVAGGRQQVSGIEQIALAMQNIDQATVQSLVSTRQMERAAQNLNQLANTLAELVEQYEL